jgi:hypothetical protein
MEICPPTDSYWQFAELAAHKRHSTINHVSYDTFPAIGLVFPCSLAPNMSVTVQYNTGKDDTDVAAQYGAASSASHFDGFIPKEISLVPIEQD